MKFGSVLFTVAIAAVLGTYSIGTVHAQSCTVCGTGSAGAFHATADTTLPSGNYEFTTFAIDAGVTVTVTGSTPLVVSATGAVTIDGALVANGAIGGDGVTSISAGLGGAGMVGGAAGGDGSYSSSSGPLDGLAGNGSGGGGFGSGWSGGGGAGYATAGQSSGGVGGLGGPAYGSPTIPVLLGGSGGGGGSGGYSCGSGGGGGGGGAVQIQSCVSISIGATGAIHTNGGNGGSDGTGNCGGGGGGSGGSLVLTSPTVTVDGQLSTGPGRAISLRVCGEAKRDETMRRARVALQHRFAPLHGRSISFAECAHLDRHEIVEEVCGREAGHALEHRLVLRVRVLRRQHLRCTVVHTEGGERRKRGQGAAAGLRLQLKRERR